MKAGHSALIMLGLIQTGCNLFEKLNTRIEPSRPSVVESAPLQPVVALDGVLTALQDGRILITGGLLWDPKYVSQANLGTRSQYSQIYDPVSKKFSAPMLMKQERYQHQAVLLPDGRVLVAGGSCDSCFSNASPQNPRIAKAEIFDPATGSWSWAGEMVHPRENFSLLVLDGRAVAIGGMIWGDVVDPLDPSGYLSSIEIYDPTTDRWQVSSARLPEGVHTPIVVALDSQRVLIAWGFAEDPTGVGSREIALSGIFTINATAERYKSGARMQVPRALASGILLSNGHVLVVGGSSLGAHLDSAEIYDPSNESWRQIQHRLPQPRSGAALIVLRGQVTLLGGDTGSATLLAGFSPLDEVLSYDEMSESWLISGSRLASPRAFPRALPVLSGQSAFVFGGLSYPGVSSLNLFEIH